MNRRSFMLITMTSTLFGSSLVSNPQPKQPSWFELRFYHLRNDLDQTRLDQFLERIYLPVTQRVGLGPVGVFDISVGPEQPSLMVLTSSPSLAAMESALDKMSKDSVWNEALNQFGKAKDMAYIRMESRLLQAFTSVPTIEIPHQDPGRAPRLFELRIYEARSTRALENKIKMFDDEEVAIFRRCGLLPVFFGKTVIGPGLPSLTYMVAYDSVEAREEAWRKFLRDPDWIRLSAKPELADSEIVSSIHNLFLRPTSYSPIR